MFFLVSPLLTSKRQLGIENLLQSDNIRGGHGNSGWCAGSVVRDESLPRVVAEAKLAKAIAAAEKDFMGK